MNHKNFYIIDDKIKHKIIQINLTKQSTDEVDYIYLRLRDYEKKILFKVHPQWQAAACQPYAQLLKHEKKVTSHL